MVQEETDMTRDEIIDVLDRAKAELKQARLDGDLMVIRNSQSTIKYMAKKLAEEDSTDFAEPQHDDAREYLERIHVAVGGEDDGAA
jgi:hypothetical protein